MADDKVQVQFGVSGEEQIAQSTERINASIEKVGTAVEGMQRRFEHVGVALSFAVASLANDQETGVTRAAHAIALLGFAWGPVVGTITTAAAIIGEELVKNFTKAQDAADKATAKIKEDIGQLANAGELGKLEERFRTLWFGTPFDEKGNLVAKSDLVVGAFKGSLADLEAEFRKTQATANETLLGGAVNAISSVSLALRTARTQAEALRTAITNIQNQPSPDSVIGLLSPSRSAADSPEKRINAVTTATENLKVALEQLPGLGGIGFVGTPSKEARQSAEQAAQAWIDAVSGASSKFTVKFPKGPDLLTATPEQLAKIKQQADEVQREWEHAFDAINHAVVDAFEKMRHGAESFADALRDIGRQILSTLAGNEIRNLEAALSSHLPGASGSSSPAPSLLGTFASVLPSLLFAAPHGFDVPGGLSPMTQLHPREMVLPEHLADVIRGMAGGGGGGAHHTHVYIGNKEVLHAVYDAQKAGHLPRGAVGRRA